MTTSTAFCGLWYKSAEIVVGGIPWIIEVAVADTCYPGDVWFACNHAPSFGDPLGHAEFDAGDIWVTGAESFLKEADATSTRMACDTHNRAAAVHVICAAPEFVDKGKVALVVPPAVAHYAGAVLDKATKVLRKEAERRRKDASKAARDEQRAREEAAREERKDQPTIKDAVFGVLPAAKAAAGLIVAVRTLFYKVRPLFQKRTDKELDYKYFSQTLLPEYQREHEVLDGLYYEPRGELHHPHDDTVTQLGTREVGDYEVPPWQFDKVLYIEKTGLQAQLAPYRLGQKYDMGIIYGKGYPVVACRDLLARTEFRDMTIFVLHDADTDGYNIARTLGEETARMPDHNIKVIDLGLTVPQAIDHGLETEHFTRKVALPTGLVLDEDADEWFTGEPFDAGNGKTHYDCTRCELNAFSSDQLAEFIEDGLARHGVSAKLGAPTGRGGRARADGPRRGAHRDGLGRDRGHDRHRRRGGRSDRRPPEPGRGRRSAHPRHVHRRPDPVMAVVGATPRERGHRRHRLASPTLLRARPRRATGHAARPRGVAPSPVWPRSSTTSTTTVTLFVEVPSASHWIAAHADTAGLDAQG